MAQYIEDRFKAQRGPTDSLSHYMRMGTCMLSVDQWWETSIIMTLTRLKYFKFGADSLEAQVNSLGNYASAMVDE